MLSLNGQVSTLEEACAYDGESQVKIECGVIVVFIEKIAESDINQYEW